ncbi:MAG: c-type cytochrome domain-containing protein [Planctomycetota bacterium]|nr:c-type cytochrome domain-containing protein [Planctomycetota bacterium]
MIRMMTERVLITLLVAVTVLTAVDFLQSQITPAQRKVELELRTQVRKAGNLFAQGKFDESAAEVIAVQKRFDEVMKEADEQSLALFSSVYNSLKKAHALLELEGISLPKLNKPMIAKPEPMPGPGGLTRVPEGKMSFVKHVVPILMAKCGNCHVRNARGMFSMADYETLMKGPEAGVVIFPKDAVGSRLVEVIEEGDMPRGGLTVTPVEFEVLKKWITEGAVFDGEDAKQNLQELNPDASVGDLPVVKPTRATGTETVSFKNDIAPLFLEHCASCHGLGQRASGRFDLTTFSGFLRGGENGPPVVPKNADESYLVKKLLGTGGGQQMPVNGDPFDDPKMELISTWINEGATFDGIDFGQSLGRVVAIAQAEKYTHEELAAERRKIALQNWNLSMSGIKSNQVDTESFLLIGSLTEAQLSAFGEQAEAVREKVQLVMKVPQTKPMIKGRVSLFFFNQRYDYSEFGKMVEQRALPREWRGHFRFDIVDAYGALIVPTSEEYSFDGLVAEQVAGIYAQTLGIVPRWFSNGMARVVAAKVVKDDKRIQDWKKNIAAAAAQMGKPDDFISGKLGGESGSLVAYSYLDFLMKNPQRFNALTRALQNGTKFDDAFAAVYGDTPAKVAEIWWNAGSSR